MTALLRRISNIFIPWCAQNRVVSQLVMACLVWGRGVVLWVHLCVCVNIALGYVICITPCSYDNKVENYRVRRNDKGLVTVDDDEYFDNLIVLVEVRWGGRGMGCWLALLALMSLGLNLKIRG